MTENFKASNRRAVLDFIRTRYPISRSQLSRISGLNKATVSGFVTDFLRQGVVAETGSGVAAAGRKPVLLSFVADSAYVIGLLLNVRSVRMVITDLEGTIVWQTREPLGDEGASSTLDRIAIIIEDGVRRVGIPFSSIVALGIGVPGLVDFQAGVIVQTPNMGLSSVSLKQWLEMRFHIPVFVDNAANVSAVGEKLFGAGRHYEHFVYVSVSTGIGGGVVMNGQLQRGAFGFAGEFGHMVVEPHGLSCRCGGQGCWEMYGSLKALYRQTARHIGEDPAAYRPDILVTVVDAAARGETWAIEGLNYIGFYLGVGVASIVSAFNPHAVLIGNEIAIGAKWIMPIIETVVQTRCSLSIIKDLTLLMLEYDDNKAVVGAAGMGIDGFLDQLTHRKIRRWC